MTRDDTSQPDATSALLLRMDAKLDRLEDKVDTLSSQVIRQDAYCEATHRRVDEVLAAHSESIDKLADAQANDQSTKDRILGAWQTIVLLVGALVAGGGLALGALQIWGGK